MRIRWTRWVWAVAILAPPPQVAAQEAPAPEPLVIAAENLMAGDERHRSLQRRGLSAQILLPGDIVRYTLTFTNVTDVDAQGVAFVDPIPVGLLYVAGSASADREDVRIEYSIDRGESYSESPVIVEEVEGRRVERTAPPEAYTHIRWTVAGSVAPGAQVKARFEARFQTLAPPSASEEPGFGSSESTSDVQPAGTDESG